MESHVTISKEEKRIVLPSCMGHPPPVILVGFYVWATRHPRYGLDFMYGPPAPYSEVSGSTDSSCSSNTSLSAPDSSAFSSIS